MLEEELRVFVVYGDVYHFLKAILEASSFHMVNQW